MKLTQLQRKELNAIFKRLETHELQHIYDIIRSNDVKFTQTTNAILFLETDISDELLETVWMYSTKRHAESLKYRQLPD